MSDNKCQEQALTPIHSLTSAIPSSAVVNLDNSCVGMVSGASIDALICMHISFIDAKNVSSVSYKSRNVKRAKKFKCSLPPLASSCHYQEFSLCCQTPLVTSILLQPSQIDVGNLQRAFLHCRVHPPHLSGLVCIPDIMRQKS